MISEALTSINTQIADVCGRIGRNNQDIALIGVTKFAQDSDVEEAINLGLLHIGENRVQVALEKFPHIPNLNKVTKHLIGHLQSNKVKLAIENFDLIHSVDSIKLVDEIQKQAFNLGKVMDILIQVNIANEEQKFGVDQSSVYVLLDHVRSLSHVHVKGLMTMAPFDAKETVVRTTFRDLKNIFNAATERYRGSNNIEMIHLSMGMSGDFKIAIEEGSNMVRVGSAIFKT
ncbi:MAG: pyridoxal phosphate enzyme (YggS family) [Candidatus Omnitrophota bacterium]|jgi:pyridoxal phosphate enzyme (YggS family)